MAEKYVVKFYFTSGKHIKVKYNEENFNRLMECLKQNWNGTTDVGLNSGVNFSYVTHYEVWKK